MMKYRYSISLLLLLFFQTMAAQPVQHSGYWQAKDPMLEKARQLSITKPEQAIKLVENILQQSKKTGNRQTEAESYLLLGNIYEQIGQTTLARRRYTEALQALRREKSTGMKPIIL